MRVARTATAGAIVLALSALMLGSTPASAVTGVGVIELSDDGSNFARAYPGVIFDDIARLVPGDTQSETIYVRNTGTVAGYLRITIRDVSYSDQLFGDSLSVKTSTSATPGVSQAISSARPCQVAHEGTRLAPGATIPVVTTLALGDLSGRDGQGAAAALSLRFTLSDTAPGSVPLSNCGGAGTSVPVTPTSPGATSERGASVLGATLTGGNAMPAPNATAAARPAEQPNDLLLPSLPSAFNLDPNTWRLHQEYFVLVLVFAVIIGAGISWFVGRRSQKDAEDV